MGKSEEEKPVGKANPNPEQGPSYGRTNINIDEHLIRKARKLTHLETKRQIVDKALDLLLVLERPLQVECTCLPRNSRGRFVGGTKLHWRNQS